MSTTMTDGSDALAIVGMSGRFPRAANIDQFWQNLRDGVECISFFSPQELEDAGINSAIIRHPSFVNAGGVLDGIDLFDAAFFGLSPREAEIQDPQQRLFLECSWEALEHAGYDPQTYDGAIGVFGGAALSSYLFNIMANPEVMQLMGSFQVLLGNDKDHVSTQVSYKLNLKGPSVTVQTACSTSLVAVCMACQHLLDHQCDMALAGGVGIKVPQRTGYMYQEGMINSPDGHCRPFDAQAKGTVGGNGVGVVVLKRFADAVRDGDTVHAMIRGFAVNNDGSAKIGYTAPSIEGQAQVIAMALAVAGVEPDTVTYVEAHGTATPLGDPIEVAALTDAYRAGTSRKNFCGIGSVKSNIGHLDPAAGVAGLIKTCLMLRHKQMPPSLHFNRPNPQIDLANSPFYVVQRLKDWSTNGVPRRAGVSSFGIGGTNAHVVLEEAPETRAVDPLRPEQLLVLSARTATALDRATSNLAGHLGSAPDDTLADVAYTCQLGRRAFPFRRFVVASDRHDAIAALTSPERALSGQASGRARVAFLFPGQGAQYANMTWGLYQTEPTYRREVDRCADVLHPHLGLDLRSLLFTDRSREAGRQLEQTALAQPALFVVEYALATVWMEWGVKPEVVAGHSIGEYVAACLSGVFSLEDALALVAMRGKAMQEIPPGSMLIVPLPEAEVRDLLKGDLDLAAVNGASLCVVSGPGERIGALDEQLRTRNVPCRRLHTSHAFHSRMMDPVVPQLTERARSVKLEPPKIPCLSNATGTWLTASDATDPSYWARHLRQTVRFADNLEHLTRESDWTLLEVGPGDTLSTLARQSQKRGSSQRVISSVRHPQSRDADTAVILNALGKLWLSGASIDWMGFHTHRHHRRVPLPTYPFERQRYWVGPRAASAASAAPSTRRDSAPVSDFTNWFYQPAWKKRPLPAEAAADGRRQRWLIFADSGGLGGTTVQQLRREGHSVVSVLAGPSYASGDAASYAIDPRRPEDYRSLIGELSASGGVPQTIVHFWGVTPDASAPSNSAFDRAQALGFSSIVSLMQALAAQRHVDAVRLEIVVSHVCAVRGDEPVDPGKATALAAAKVIPQEHPHVRCRTIDVTPGTGNPPDEELAGLLLNEFRTRGPETVVAYREGGRWVQRFEPVKLQSGSAGTRLLRDRGVYLVTGGLGKIGLTVAENLARAVQPSLVLLTRSEFPPSTEWSEWLRSRGDADRVSRTIRRLQAIEELGARVMVLRADVADPDQLEGAVKEARRRFGSINGVLHAAGETSQDAFGAIASVTSAACERQFRPKVRGLLALEEALRGTDVDFWVLFSSLSAVLGGLGFAAYAAANVFLDAFATRQNQAGASKWISVDWDGWDFTGRAETPAIPPDSGADAFRLILAQGRAAQIVVSVTDLNARLAQWIEMTPSATPEPALTGSADRHIRPDLNNPYVVPRNEVERTLAGIWAEFLGLDRVGIHDNFFELGGHSLLAIQVVSRIRSEFQIDLVVHAMFETPTVAQLAGTIGARDSATPEDSDRVEKLLDMIEGMSDDEIKAMLGQQGAS